MKIFHAVAPIAASLALIAVVPATAQTTSKTKVSTDTDVNNGVATRTTKVVHVQKHKTRRAKRILGVKVGHKTAVKKTVKETSHSTNGDTSTTVKTTHN